MTHRQPWYTMELSDTEFTPTTSGRAPDGEAHNSTTRRAKPSSPRQSSRRDKISVPGASADYPRNNLGVLVFGICRVGAHETAKPACVCKLLSRNTKVSNMFRIAEFYVPVLATCGSILSGPPRAPTTTSCAAAGTTKAVVIGNMPATTDFRIPPLTNLDNVLESPPSDGFHIPRQTKRLIVGKIVDN